MCQYRGRDQGGGVRAHRHDAYATEVARVEAGVAVEQRLLFDKPLAVFDATDGPRLEGAGRVGDAKGVRRLGDWEGSQLQPLNLALDNLVDPLP